MSSPSTIIRNITPTINGTVHWCSGDRFVWSRQNELFLGDIHGSERKSKTAIQVPITTKLKWLSRKTQRLFRLDIKQMVELSPNLLGINVLGSFYHLDLETFQLEKVSDFPGPTPLRMCFDGKQILFGEYFGNMNRDPVNVWRSVDLGRSWQKIQTFTDVRHIHGIFYDPFIGKHWMTTGDLDHESHLRCSDDYFFSYETLFSGKQLYRIIELLFREDDVLYGTDTPFEKNFIVRIDRKSGDLKKIQEVGGSIFYLREHPSGMYCTTAVEPSDYNKSPFCEVWHSENGEEWHIITQFRKDAWSATYFQFGRVQISAGAGSSDGVWISPIAAGHDGKSCFINRSLFATNRDSN